jgi:hypothetical protein
MGDAARRADDADAALRRLAKQLADAIEEQQVGCWFVSQLGSVGGTARLGVRLWRGLRCR